MKLDLKKILIFLIVFVIGCVGSVVGYVAYTKSKSVVKKEYFPLEQSIMVNLKPDKNEEKVLKMTLTFEYTDKKGSEKITEGLSKIQDTIINTASDKKASELVTSKQKDEFKIYLSKAINKALGEEIITDILFTEFITN